MDHIQALLKGSVKERRLAALSLGQSRDIAAIPTLLQALNDSQVRKQAVEALGQIGEIAVLPALVHILTDSKPNRYDDLDYELRQTVVKALGQLGHSALPTLIEALMDTHPVVRSEAAKALGNIGDNAAVPALHRALADRVRGVRYAAVYSLGNIPNIADIADITIIPALLQVVEDLDFCVFNTLDKIGDANTLPGKVLVATHISVADRIDILERMGHVKKYKVLPVEQYCAELVQRDDCPEDVKVGARDVLAHQTLLRPGARDSVTEPSELLRAASALDDVASPAEALRASEAPQGTPPKQQARKSHLRTLWQRLFV